MKLRPICLGAIMLLAIGATQMVAAGESIDLAGTWQFAIDRHDEGIKSEWYRQDSDASITLPGSMAEHGLGDDLSVNTPWSALIVDKSWYTHKRYEKYRQPGNIKLPWMLTPKTFYSGTAWYQRSVAVPGNWAGKRVVLNLERTHWVAQVWVDGVQGGMGDSLNTPNRFDVTDLVKPGGKNRISIRISNRNTINNVFLGISSHTMTDNAQGSWHGIVGDISLTATDKVWLDDVQIYPDVENKRANVKIALGNLAKSPTSGTVTVAAQCGGINVAAKTISFKEVVDGHILELDYPMGDDVQLWDEFNPTLYTLHVKMTSGGFTDSRAIKFGMRECGRMGKQISVNGGPVHLRGTVDCTGFPLTGYPPTDVESWRRIVGICKDYGLNHIRFHSWCPPDAAFTAADELGVYLQVEAGGNQVWLSSDDGATEKWFMAETKRILSSYGNHPSLIMLAHGNEATGGEGLSTHATAVWLNGYVAYFKKHDSRVMYTSSAGYPLAAENDFHNMYKPRIHFWGHNLGSRINALPPETTTDYQDWVKAFPVPLVSHETGQWCAFPNLRELPKYTGYAEAGDFEIVKDSLHQRSDSIHLPPQLIKLG